MKIGHRIKTTKVCSDMMHISEVSQSPSFTLEKGLTRLIICLLLRGFNLDSCILCHGNTSLCLFNVTAVKKKTSSIRNTCVIVGIMVPCLTGVRIESHHGQLCLVVFMAITTAIYRLKHGLHTLTAVPRSTCFPPSIGR